MARKHNLDEVLRTLNKKSDLRIGMVGNIATIQILSASSIQRSNDIGNGSWGKIDFLVNHCGFQKTIVDKFNR